MSNHDAGGKVKTKIKNMSGGAEYLGKRNCCRVLLWRKWGKSDKFPLFIGMNSSTATETHNDPTITREIGFSKLWGYDKYVKCNVSPYRLTNPKLLTEKKARLYSLENRSKIIEMALKADKIILCCGNISKTLERLATRQISALKEAGVQLYCFGLTKKMFPKHTLYLSKTSCLYLYTDLIKEKQ